MRQSGNEFKKPLMLLAIAATAMLSAYSQSEQKAMEQPQPEQQKQSQPVQPPSEYSALLARVKGGDLSIDFKQLRVSWMESPERHAAKDTSEQEKAMGAAMRDGDFKKAIRNADVVLDSEFVNLDAHLVEGRAYKELHDDKKAEFHRAVLDGLLRSIMDSGDGKSAKTAFVVITVHEEYIILSVLGLMPSEQSVQHTGGHSYDVLKAKKRDSNETVTLYFNVDIPFKHYLN
jgi:uncharacterized protein DUF4919